MSDPPAGVRETLAAVFREESGRLCGFLTRWLGDLALAEELVQDAQVAALEHWPIEGIPRRPGAWLWTVARRAAMNRAVRDRRLGEKLAELGRVSDRDDPPEEPDDRLRLLFTCCHPALAREAQVALTLRAVCGPMRAGWPIWSSGCWDRAMIRDAIEIIEKAGAMGRPGPYQVEAAIAACHAEAASYPETDWAQILALYDLLMVLAPSTVVELNRAVALGQVAGPEVALAAVNSLAGELDGYYLFHAIRGNLLIELGRREQATAAHLRALQLTANPAERDLIQRRLGDG